jgi:hypothetical protein
MGFLPSVAKALVFIRHNGTAEAVPLQNSGASGAVESYGFQPSLRDLLIVVMRTQDFVLGYFRASLRDFFVARRTAAARTGFWNSGP